MTIEEIIHLTQTLTFEERKKLIQELFAQMPRTGGLAGTIKDVRDFDAAKQAVRTLVNESVERSAQQLQMETEERD